jgi:hypothetical protein
MLLVTPARTLSVVTTETLFGAALAVVVVVVIIATSATAAQAVMVLMTAPFID